jgi:PAS domain S-box-containing protein
MNSKESKLALLRRRAEVALQQSLAAPHTHEQNLDEVIHELNVYHIELEIQLEDLQQSYRELETAQNRYANLFEFAPVGYIVTDRQGSVVNANLTASRMLGVKREALESETFGRFIMPEFQDVYHLCRRAVQQTHQAESCEAQIQSADETIFYAQLNMDLPDLQAETLRIAITNISTVKLVEEALKQALVHEKEVNELQTHVLSVIAHEFRTPLTIILSMVETLDHYGSQLPDDKKQQRYQTIRNLVWYLNDTVEDARSIGSMDDQPLDLKLEVFDIIAFVRQIAHDMELMAKEGQTILLETNSLKEVEPVTWDQNLIRRIIMNLLNNALIYSSEQVHCYLECLDDIVRLRVEDHGIGISEEDQHYIYDAFYRGKNTAFIRGMGIGLFVAKRAVEAHGGIIQCESNLGKGTVFTIELPRKVSLQPPHERLISQPHS